MKTLYQRAGNSSSWKDFLAALDGSERVNSVGKGVKEEGGEARRLRKGIGGLGEEEGGGTFMSVGQRGKKMIGGREDQGKRDAVWRRWRRVLATKLGNEGATLTV
ncbi:hypothetical protein Salat_2143800 [Sesamum alatum]|uniref:Uncharacterized protein n=1 Tax=Sesamum alatum TaxID=300844 RepID=A0AAE1Y192_9LAMI|nr:hypothetical protein Salat_2143800 [Sesamum alatum]